MYCIDTSIIIDFMRGDAKIAHRMRGLSEAGAALAITHASLCELYKGALLAEDSNAKIEAVNALVQTLDIIGLDVEACFTFGSLFKALQKKGKTVPEFDLLIAAVAMAHNKVLVTRDKHFQSVPGLKLERW
jgi:tRNA(fMet)-specific endonuclease VapC